MKKKKNCKVTWSHWYRTSQPPAVLQEHFDCIEQKQVVQLTQLIELLSVQSANTIQAAVAECSKFSCCLLWMTKHNNEIFFKFCNGISLVQIYFTFII